MSEELIKALVATGEVMGARLSEVAIDLMVDDLQNYPLPGILSALKRVRQDGTRFNVAEIIKRLPGMWPGAEQAWASFPRSEEVSACICQEMADAWGVACQQDEITGRMAFKETYNRAISQAMAEGRQPKWFITPGSDAAIREQVTMDAVQQQLISPSAARVHLPYIPTEELQLLASGGTTTNKLIESHAQTVPSLAHLKKPETVESTPEEAKAHLAKLRELVT